MINILNLVQSVMGIVEMFKLELMAVVMVQPPTISIYRWLWKEDHEINVSLGYLALFQLTWDRQQVLGQPCDMILP